MQEKALTSMHSVGLEPAKLILIGTRTTYQATGDASMDGINSVYDWNKRDTLSVLIVCMIGTSVTRCCQIDAKRNTNNTNNVT